MELSRPRWKGKDFAKIANLNPISEIITQLISSLSSSKSTSLLSGTNSLLETLPILTDLLNRTAFGREIITSKKDEQYFQFGPEETFYLYHELKCKNIASTCDNETLITEMELWNYMRSKKELFPVLYKAYSHLRNKNWVVRCGIQYEVDFVAYRHHPALVHSEYAVIVDLEGERGERNGGRIRVWSDLNCAIRVCNSVAKTILVLGIRGFNEDDLGSVNCLEKMIVDERIITRWIPSQCRDLLDNVEINETFC